MTDNPDAASDDLARARAALADRYDVQSKLGEGGMAVVYLARDRRHDREVALKVFRPELTSAIGQKRFLLEIQVAARLNHPNIVPLFDSGDAGGLLYYVMPRVEGESLQSRLERDGQLPVDEAKEIALAVASALHYAHEEGLVHRDIKPGNIMLSRGHALVTDFGICRALDAAGGETLTATGGSVGTPTYMAPEQWDSSATVDGRADIYSLGCTLYEMLVGQPPFSGKTMAAIMARHSLEAVPPPSIQRGTIDPQLEEVILRALQKAPADRFQTAGDLERALKGEATGGLFWPSLRRSIRIHGSRYAGPMATAAMVVVGLVVWSIIQRGVPLSSTGGPPAAAANGAIGSSALPLNRVGVLYFRDASSDGSIGYLADGLTEALIDQLSQGSGLQVVSRNGAMRFRGRDAPFDSIARVLRAGTLISGWVDQDGDDATVSVAVVDGESGSEFRRGQFSRATSELLTIQDDLAEEVATALRGWLGAEVDVRRDTRETASVPAWAFLQRGRRAFNDGEQALVEGDLTRLASSFTTADSLFSLAEEQDPAWARPPSQRAHLAVRWAQLSAGDPMEAGEWIGVGLGHAERALDIDPSTPEALEARGMLRYVRWALSLEPDPSAAAALLGAAEDDLRAAVRMDAGLANSWNLLSVIHSEKPDLIEANLAARRAYEEDAFLRAADQILWRLYATSYDLEQFPAATEYCDEGRRRFPDSPEFVECRLWLLASRALEPDVESAWDLLTEYEGLSSPHEREYNLAKGQIIVGGVISRAGLADSANSVWGSARPGPELDPTLELLGIEAVFRVQAGDEETAIELLKRYLTVSPEHRSSWRWSSHWWWRDLGDNPEFRDLIGASEAFP